MFLSFLLAHCIADFLLQPAWLIDLKSRSWKGIVFHVWIHTVALLFVFWPGFGDYKLWLTTGFIVFLHGLIDTLKVHFQNKKNQYVIPFFIDQILHIIVLILSIILFKLSEGFMWLSPNVALIILIILGLTIVYEIVYYQFLLEKKGRIPFKPSLVHASIRAFIVIALLWIYFSLST